MSQTRPSLVGAPLGSTMFRLAIPSLTTALLFAALISAETAFLGTAGTDALASIAVVFPLVMLSAMLSGGAFGGAISGATARAIGAGDAQTASEVLLAAAIIGLIGGSMMGVLVLLLGPALYHWTADSAQIAAAATGYAKIVFPAIPLFWVINCLNAVMRGRGDLVRPAIVAAVMLISYCVFATWLILPRQTELITAMRGAGYAVVLSYICGILVSVWFVIFKQRAGRFSLLALNGKVVLSVVKQGLLASSQATMTMVYALVCTAIFSRFGTEWLAGYGLAVRLEIIMMPVIFGIGGALIPLVGAHIGAGLKRRGIEIAWRGIFANGIIVGLLGIYFARQPETWCSPFSSNETVLLHCTNALATIGPTYGFFAIGLTCYIASQAVNTLLFPILGSLLRLLIAASCLLWVTPDTSPQTVLYIIAVAVILYGLSIAFGLHFGPWKSNHETRARNPTRRR